MKLLLIDDEAVNLDILTQYFSRPEYEIVIADGGIKGWELLEQHKGGFDVILLDRMMPDLNGIDFMKKLNANPEYRNIPVIMQTASAASTQVLEGVEAGVFYYLTKPFTKEMVMALVASAYEKNKRLGNNQDNISRFKSSLKLLVGADFFIRTMDDAKNLATLLGLGLMNSEHLAIGLFEIMINAIEHGNYGISYEQKKTWKLSGSWNQEFHRLIKENEEIDLFAVVKVREINGNFVVRVEDRGNGFDIEQYKEVNANRLTDPNGRGIMTIMNSGFKSVEFFEGGSIVECVL